MFYWWKKITYFEIKEITRKKSVQEVLKQYLLTTDSALIKLKSWLVKHQDNEILLHNHVRSQGAPLARTNSLFIQNDCQKKSLFGKTINFLPVCVVAFLNSKFNSFLEISERGRPSKTVFVTIKVGMQQGFLKGLNQFFSDKRIDFIYNLVSEQKNINKTKKQTNKQTKQQQQQQKNPRHSNVFRQQVSSV